MEIAQTVIMFCISVIVTILFLYLSGKSDEGNIFVSYAEEDKDRVEFAVEVIKKQLKSRLGNSYKILTVKDIPPGSRMPCAKKICIERADICIAFLSDNYIKNDDCKWELNLMNYSTVIPIFLNCDEDVFNCSKNIIDRKGIFLVGCYSHRLIKDKMILLTKELRRMHNY